MDVHPLTKIVVRLAAAFGLLVALAYLFSRAFIPSGRVTIVDDFIHAAPYLSEPKPSERLGDAVTAADGTSRRPLIGRPLFVDLTPPSGFETATFTLAYENAGQPVVEFGALASSIDEQYAVQPMEHRVIDALPWKQVSSGSLTLYERGDAYASVDEFLRRPPPVGKLATYRAVADVPYRLEGYVPATTDRTVTLSVRGHARLLTYVKDEPLSFTFSVQDMNRLQGADPITVSVYKGDSTQAVSRVVVADDGDTSSDQHSSPLRTVPVSVTAPSEGFYRIEFTASPDVFIRSFVTRQRKLVFEDDLYLGDHVGYSDRTDPITVYTDGGHLAARTPHAEAVQTMSVDGTAWEIGQPNIRYEKAASASGALAAVTVPKRDMLLQTVGVFALSPDDYFNPLPYTLQWFSTPAELDRRGIDYVLSSYEPPATEGGLKVAKVTFDLSTLARTETGAYRFVIEAPGIEETRYQLLLKSLTVTLQRPPLTYATLLTGIFDAFRPQVMAPGSTVIDGRTYGESPL